MAEKMGADEAIPADESQDAALRRIAPMGFDLVFEATGSADIVQRTFQYVKGGGKIVLYGIVPPEHQAAINPFDICRKDLQVIGSFSSINACSMAHELLAGNVIQVEPFISHRFSLDQWGEAVAMARDHKTCMRAIVLTPAS